MSRETRPPRATSTWDQPSLIPPEVIRVDFTWFADVHMQRQQFGWTISDGVEEQTVGMEVLSWIDLATTPLLFSTTAMRVMEAQRSRACPFP